MYTWGNNKFCAISLMKSPAAGKPFRQSRKAFMSGAMSVAFFGC